MTELIRKLVKDLQLVWSMLIISMVIYIPVVFFVVKKEKLKGSAPGHLEGMWPIFLVASLILGTIAILQYKKFTEYNKLEEQIKNKNCPPEEYFRDKKTGEISKSNEVALNRLDEKEKMALHLPSLYWKPLIIGLCFNSVVAISGVCLSLSTHSVVLGIPFVLLGVFFSLFMLPKQTQLIDIAYKITKSR